MKKIKLSKGKFAIVDDEDYEEVSRHKWFANKAKNGQYRAIRNVRNGGGSIYMHRMIMKVSDPNVWVDHKDRNQLNNRRSNLRLCNSQQSACNVEKKKTARSSSKYRGVYFCDRPNKWRVFIRNKGKHMFLGRFKKERDAAVAYNNAAIKYQGEFAVLNKV